MSHIKTGCTFLLALILAPASLATADMRLSEILAGVQKRYADLPGLSIPYKREIITRSMALLGGSMDADTASGQIHFRPPKFLKVQQDTPKPETIISDGNTLWWYVPHKSQVYRYPSHQLGKEIQLLNDIFQGLRAVEESFDVMLMEMDEKGGYPLKLIPNPPWAEIHHIMLSVSQENFTVREVEIHNQIGGITRFILGDLSVKENFPEDFFKFMPPEGVKVIEQEG
ncbi:MAG: outer membrane lipoprotein carrier protein LolA [Deltaproteobacteria bacterium]|nr:MAG: outer membrane lipoprotein carrier protein LolA [Deltaproteobacteria bacterium]